MKKECINSILFWRITYVNEEWLSSLKQEKLTTKQKRFSRLLSSGEVNMPLASVLNCPTVPLSNGLQIPVLGLGVFLAVTVFKSASTNLNEALCNPRTQWLLTESVGLKTFK